MTSRKRTASDYERENAELKKQVRMLKEQARMHKEQARMHKERADKMSVQARMRKERADKMSVLTVLPGTDALEIPELECRGLGNSHQRPKNEKAIAYETIDFPIPNIRDLDNRLELGLNESVSCLRSCINSAEGVLVYENEYDVLEIVHSALRDATLICNVVIRRQAQHSKCGQPLKLGVRRESPLFSNIFDHIVVFDSMSNAPVFSVKTKQVWKTGVSERVFGQVYDQLRHTQATGHPNPFGAVTCFDKTHICWLDNSSSQKVLDELKNEEYSHSRLERIVRSISSAPADEGATQNYNHKQPITQSPVKEKEATADVDFHQEGFSSEPPRQLKHSAAIPAKDLVAAFVSAIFCSLDGFRHPRGIMSFQMGQEVEAKVLCLNWNSHTWGTLRTIYRGNKKLKKIIPFISTVPRELYLVDHLGTGSTSKSYRALTSDGYDCVVKMYVKRRGDNKQQLTKKEFEKSAKEAVKREVKEYETIYGDELKGYVWHQTLDGMHCVVHPYFKHPNKDDRLGLRSKIIERLRDCFAKHDKYYVEDDQSWRHIGMFQGELYLFDLADLETDSECDANTKILSHIDELCRRASIEKMQVVHG